MKTKTKALLITMCAALLVVATVFTTLAFLTDTENVVNTFTVGDVQIDLDETIVDEYGKVVTGEGEGRTTDGNEYRLLPGHEYTKDPTVHVLANSEDCYVRVFVTMNNTDTVNTALANHGKTTKDLLGPTEAGWTLQEATIVDDTNHTITYEYRYDSIVTRDKDYPTELTPFSTISIPKELTNAEVASFNKTAETTDDFKMYIYAEAIQADGFDGDATKAFGADGLGTPSIDKLTNGAITL